MQADELAELRKPDPFAMARHLFEDREGAPERAARRRRRCLSSASSSPSACGAAGRCRLRDRPVLSLRLAQAFSPVAGLVRDLKDKTPSWWIVMRLQSFDSSTQHVQPSARSARRFPKAISLSQYKLTYSIMRNRVPAARRRPTALRIGPQEVVGRRETG